MTNPIQLTVFRTKFDNNIEKTMEFSTWDDFTLFLQSLSHINQTKQTAPLISPAIYYNGTIRANINVEKWGGWCAVDVDSIKFPKNCDTVNKIKSHIIDITPFFNNFFCYSTASSKIETPKYRIVLQLTDPLFNKNNDILHFWHALNDKLGNIVDTQTKDVSRMFFVPGNYIDSCNFTINYSENKIPPIDPYKLINEYKFFPSNNNPTKNIVENLPQNIKDKFLNYKKTHLLTNSKDYKWTSYKNCKYVNKTLIDEYKSIQEGRWYSKLYSIIVSIAFNAIRDGYPITIEELVALAKEIDFDTGGWYSKRPLSVEAARALQYVYLNY
jgi:hypothetical protein